MRFPKSEPFTPDQISLSPSLSDFVGFNTLMAQFPNLGQRGIPWASPGGSHRWQPGRKAPIEPDSGGEELGWSQGLAGRGLGLTTASSRSWEGKGSSPLEQTTPASFSCPQRLFSQPRELQLASEDSVPVHSTSSSMMGPFPVGTKGSRGPHWRRNWTLGGEQVLQQGCSLTQ